MLLVNGALYPFWVIMVMEIKIKFQFSYSNLMFFTLIFFLLYFDGWPTKMKSFLLS